MKPFACYVFPVCIYLLILATGCGSKTDKPDALAFQPAKDNVYTFSLLRLQNVLQGASIKFPESSTADTLLLDGEWSLNNYRDSLTVMKFTFNELQVKETSQTGRTIFRRGFMSLGRAEFVFERDSLLKLLKGRSILLTFNNHGQVLEVKGIDKLQDSLSAIVKFPV